jgi:hypothetical protein
MLMQRMTMILKERAGILVLMAICCALPGAATAGAPGSADRKAALRNVCASGPNAIDVCDPTEVDPCGANAQSEPFACVVDYSQLPSFRGTLTLIADEEPADNNSAGGNPTITMLMEYRISGQLYYIAKTFQTSLAGQFPEIGHWLPPAQADEIQAIVNSILYQTPVESLKGVGQALTEIAEREIGGSLDVSASTPVVYELNAMSNQIGIDQYAGAGLAEVSRFQIEIRFVEHP